MILSISHEAAQELLTTEALDGLKGAERDALLAHVRDCGMCSTHLAQLRETTAFLAESVPIVPMDSRQSAAIRSRLLARAAADLASRRGEAGGQESDQLRAKAPTSAGQTLESEPVRPIGRPPVSRGGWYAAAAAVMLAAGILAVLRSTRRDAAIANSELAGVRAERLEAERKVTVRDSLLEQLTGATVLIVSLTGSGPTAPVGWLTWDQNERWTLLAHDLPVAAADRTYQLWLITPGQRKLSAGTFATDQRGHALFRTTLPLPRDSLAAVTVTLEPAGGVPQPTGPIALSGK